MPASLLRRVHTRINFCGKEMKLKIQPILKINWKTAGFYILGLLFMNFSSYAQRVGVEHPPRPVTTTVNMAQGLIFGAFYRGSSGGSVTVLANGSRSTTGTIILASLGFSFSPAIFQIDVEPGAIITISNGPDVNITGSNGGSMSLHIGSSDVGSPFTTTVVPPSTTQVRIGGTLTVGTALANPSGDYSGTFSVTFIQQ